MLRETDAGGRRAGPEKGSSRRGFGRLRRERSGNYSAAYTGPDGQLHKAPHTFETKMDAEGWLAVERRAVLSGEWQAPDTRRAVRAATALTLGAYAEQWLADRTLKPRTRDHYRQLLDRLVLPDLGGLPLKALSPTVVRSWHAGLGTSTPTLRAHAYGLLRTILGSAVDEEHLKANPCHIRGAGNAKRARRIKPATVAELGAIVEAMPDKYRALVLLAAWCAFRFGELAEMRRRDVDLTNAVIRVRRGVVRTSEGRLIGTPKSDAGSRDVAIPPHLVPFVKRHLAEHAEPGRDGLLFPAANGGHLAPSTLQKPFYRARAAAGRPDLRFHDLRHTGAVLAAATGATLAELMARLGHSTAGAALRYQHAAQDRDRAIAEALSKMAGGAL